MESSDGNQPNIQYNLFFIFYFFDNSCEDNSWVVSGKDLIAVDFSSYFHFLLVIV